MRLYFSGLCRSPSIHKYTQQIKDKKDEMSRQGPIHSQPDSLGSTIIGLTFDVKCFATLYSLL